MCVLLLAVTLSLGLSLIDSLFPLELANLVSLPFSPIRSSGASFSTSLPRLWFRSSVLFSWVVVSSFMWSTCSRSGLPPTYALTKASF